MDAIWVGIIGGAVTVIMSVISFVFGRRRANSESGKLDSESIKLNTESESLTALTIKTFQSIYQDLIRDQTGRISRLEAEQTASGTRIVGLETLIAEQKLLITSLRKEIDLLKKQLVKEGHVPETPED